MFNDFGLQWVCIGSLSPDSSNIRYLKRHAQGPVKLPEFFHQPRTTWFVLMRRVRHQVPVLYNSCFEYILPVAPSQSGEVCFPYPTSILRLRFHSIHQSDSMSFMSYSCHVRNPEMPRCKKKLRPTRWLWYKPTGENSSRQAELEDLGNWINLDWGEMRWKTPSLWLQKRAGFVHHNASSEPQDLRREEE